MSRYNVFNCSNCNCQRMCHNCCNCQNRCQSHNSSCNDDHPMSDVGFIHPDNVATIANGFLDEYYDKVMNRGWNFVQYIYTPDAIIICNSHIFTGGHEFLNFLSQDYIRRANFGNLRSSWSLVDESKMVINVFGEIQLVSFTNDHGGVGHFSDTFIIKAYPDGTCMVINHTLNFT